MGIMRSKPKEVHDDDGRDEDPAEAVLLSEDEKEDTVRKDRESPRNKIRRTLYGDKELPPKSLSKNRTLDPSMVYNSERYKRVSKKIKRQQIRSSRDKTNDTDTEFKSTDDSKQDFAQKYVGDKQTNGTRKELEEFHHDQNKHFRQTILHQQKNLEKCIDVIGKMWEEKTQHLKHEQQQNNNNINTNKQGETTFNSKFQQQQQQLAYAQPSEARNSKTLSNKRKLVRPAEKTGEQKNIKEQRATKMRTIAKHFGNKQYTPKTQYAIKETVEVMDSGYALPQASKGKNNDFKFNNEHQTKSDSSSPSSNNQRICVDITGESDDGFGDFVDTETQTTEDSQSQTIGENAIIGEESNETVIENGNIAENKSDDADRDAIEFFQNQCYRNGNSASSSDSDSDSSR